MAYTGAGALWDMASGTFIATNIPGIQADYNAAKAAISSGIFYVGPGLEALVLGTFGPNVSLMRVTNTGIYAISRFHVADGTDPTKLVRFDASGVTSGATRVATLPDWSGVVPLPPDLGVSGTFLKSRGSSLAPSWVSVVITNALLDGSNHTDTVAQAVLRGALIVGNSTPKWDRLALGAAGQVLTSDGVDAVWSASGATALEHNTLFHLKPFTATNVSMGAASAQLVTTGGQFANVRVGDRINLDDARYPASTFGMRVSALIDSNNITMDLTNTGGAQSGATATIFPGDHIDNTLVAGLLTSGGYGTWDQGSNPGGTRMTLYGSYDFRNYANSGSQRFTFDCTNSLSNPSGFGWKKKGAGNPFMWVYAQNLTIDRFVKLPDLDGTFLFDGGAQNVTDKKLIGNNELQMDDIVGNSTGTHLADVNDATKKYYFDFTAIATGTGKKAKWNDLSAGGHVDFTYLATVTGIDGKTVGTTTLYTVPSGKTVVVTRVVVRCTAATAITVGPTFGVGIAAGEDDIVTSAAHTAFQVANTFVFCAIKDPAALGLTTNVIKLGIDTAATGTSMTLAVDIAGYLV